MAGDLTVCTLESDLLEIEKIQLGNQIYALRDNRLDTSLNDKADIDLSNLNQQGNNAISAPLYSHLSDFILEAPNGIVETQSNYIDWTQPVYTSNTSYGSITLDDGDMENLWHAFDNNNITFAVVQGTSISGTFTVNYPTKKKVSHIYIYNGQESGSYQGLANIKVYAINDGQSTLILDLNGSGSTTNVWDEDVSNVVCDSLQFIATRPSTGYSSAINTITVSAQSLEPNTIVVKQGVKVLMPNGFNADGTYKNIEYALTSDKTQTSASNYAVNGLIGITNGGILPFSYELLKTDYFPTASSYSTYALYRTDLNKTYRAQNVSGTYQWVETPFAIVCRYVHNKGSITTIQPVGIGRIDTARNTFINASPNLTRTQSFTIRSGVTYYMPFDGYLFVNGAGASGMHITVDGVEAYYSGAAGSTSNIIPIQFGGKIVSTGNISGCWLAPAVCYK